MKILGGTRPMQIFFALALACVTTACASAGRTSIVRVTYISDPPGAAVYEGGKQWGRAPFTLTYHAPARFTECLRLNPVTVRWVSGAEVSVDTLDACPAAGRDQQFTLFRPKGVDGLDLDVQFAIAAMQPAAAPAASEPTHVPITMPRTCTTSVIGNQIFTNCSR